MMLLLPLYAAILPFIVWVIEQVLPYPYIIEELAKLFLVLMLRSDNWRSSYSNQLKIIILSGTLFALSETVLYLFNIYLVGEFRQLVLRLLLTTSLHVLTLLIIFVSFKKDVRIGVVGVLAAICIHYAFNQLIAILL